LNPKDYKVLFYREAGKSNFKLFIDGKEITCTKGVVITAGNGEEIQVTPNLVISYSENIKD
jgi:uncharacterized alkaline shock family protein YloU